MKVGDTVELKSGGPAMVITSRDETSATCLWHSWSRVDGCGMSCYDFPLTCLKPYVEPPKDATAPSVSTEEAILRPRKMESR